MGLKGNALIGQSGGPSPVINASLVGAVEAARDYPDIEAFYGALHGLDGVLNERMIDLFREDPDVVAGIGRTPSAALGSSRLKPKEADLQRVFEVFKAHNIRYFFYIGGNDSQLACHKISELAKKSEWEIRIIGVPKTIDNDLMITDNSPGFGSAARYAAAATSFVGRDAEAFANIEVVEIMGRNAGWVAGATQVPRKRQIDPPHLAYVPEFEVDIGQMVADARAAFKEYGYLVVAVSEGLEFEAADDAEEQAQLDEFGHKRLEGVAQRLGALLEKEVGVRARWDRLGNLQRCFAYCTSRADREEGYAVGRDAVRRAANGETDVMITIQRKTSVPFTFECETTSLLSVADKVKVVPREWINEAGNGITQEFVDYVAPLIEGEEVSLDASVPTFPRFQKHQVAAKLPPYARPE
jgi:6-phosphofructokinase 1